jgi:ABC-type dipeptide/oligopeptide/nickel transport system permease subunit
MKLLWDFWKNFKRNKGAVLGLFVICAFLVIAVFAPLISPYNPAEIYPDSASIHPFWSSGNMKFILGTDDVGRDLLSRLIYGARISMGVGFLVVIFSLSTGTFLGLIAGYFGGWIDKTVTKLTDILMSLPSILLAVVVVSILGPGLINAVIAVSIVTIPSFTRIVRASVIAEKSKPYVMASRSYGANHFRILFINIFPNCLAPLIVQGTLGFSEGILSVAALGFLGLGAQPPEAEWGTMLADSRPFIESLPWLVTLPGLCILIVVLGFNIFGDGLRDALDPKLKN